jgi:chromosome partitioning protein
MKTIAIANQRSGVGKTATTLSLGMALAERNARVLMVDLDPQAALSAACGVDECQGESLAEVIGGSQPGKLNMREILREVLPERHCLLAPSELALAQSELGLNFRMGREGVLRKAMEKIASDFDVALIDCPSSLGMLSVNALNTAQAVLVPTRPELLDMRGVLLFLAELERIKEEINPKLETLGVLVTYYNQALEPHRNAILAMKDAGLSLLPPGIELRAQDDGEDIKDDLKPVHATGDPEVREQIVSYVEQWLAGWRAWEPSASD